MDKFTNLVLKIWFRIFQTSMKAKNKVIFIDNASDSTSTKKKKKKKLPLSCIVSNQSNLKTIIFCQMKLTREK